MNSAEGVACASLSVAIETGLASCHRANAHTWEERRSAFHRLRNTGYKCSTPQYIFRVGVMQACTVYFALQYSLLTLFAILYLHDSHSFTFWRAPHAIADPIQIILCDSISLIASRASRGPYPSPAITIYSSPLPTAHISTRMNRMNRWRKTEALTRIKTKTRSFSSSIPARLRKAPYPGSAMWSLPPP